MTTRPARPHSLQRRLGLGLGAGVAALWLAGAVAAGLILRGEIDEVFDSALQEVAQRILPLAYTEVLNSDPLEDSGSPGERLPAVLPHAESITYIVRDGTGRVLLRSHDADLSAFPPAFQPGFQDTPLLRLYTEGAVQGSLFITTAEPVQHRREATLEAVGMLLWPLALVLPLSQLGVWALVRFILRPVRDLQGEIEARGHGNLSPVGTKGLPTELSPVAGAVNQLIARLHRALAAERGFTASSAHELRTPVAAALAQTQRLMAELPEGPPRDRARSVETALRQLSQLSEKLLQLAKAEGGSLLAETPQDLVQVLRLVLDDLRRDPAIAARLRIAFPARGQFLSSMDADGFAILARNLIENALKHGTVDRPVSVELTEDGLLSVTNEGPAIPAETLTRLRRPFERGATLATGSGLGLAIAEAIATGTGTKLELLSPIPGQLSGFAARLRLPVDS